MMSPENSTSLKPTVRDLNAGGVTRRRKNARGPLYRKATIHTLPDDVLLEIFNFYVIGAYFLLDVWPTLVHVSRRWRNVVFASPRRLDLRIICTPSKLVRKRLEVWPALPIIVWGIGYQTPMGEGGDNIIPALEHHDRVCVISLDDVPGSLLGNFAAAMQEPFPALTTLGLESTDETALALPDSFLGGSAPRLQSLALNGVPFPAVWKLLLTTTNLSYLDLSNIPSSGYISPEAMVTCLAALTKLASLKLEFRSPRSRPDISSWHPPPVTRIVLPALVSVEFQGDCEYIEDLVSRLNVPLLRGANITFFNRLIFDIPQLLQFIARTEKLKATDQAIIVFHRYFVDIVFSRQNGRLDEGQLALGISCTGSDWQLSSLAQICTSSLLSFSNIERLDIYMDYERRPYWPDDMENAQWLELLYPFSAVKNLCLGNELVQRVAPALREFTGEMVTEMLPALQNIILYEPRPSGPVQDVIGQFVDSRRLSGQPVAVQWEW